MYHCEPLDILERHLCYAGIQWHFITILANSDQIFIMGTPSLTQKVLDFTGSPIFWKVEWGSTWQWEQTGYLHVSTYGLIRGRIRARLKSPDQLNSSVLKPYSVYLCLPPCRLVSLPGGWGRMPHACVLCLTQLRNGWKRSQESGHFTQGLLLTVTSVPWGSCEETERNEEKRGEGAL